MADGTRSAISPILRRAMMKDMKPPTTAEGPGASENKMEPIIEQTLEVMQSVYELLHEKVLRAEQKNDVCNKMAWAIE